MYSTSLVTCTWTAFAQVADFIDKREETSKVEHQQSCPTELSTLDMEVISGLTRWTVVVLEANILVSLPCPTGESVICNSLKWKVPNSPWPTGDGSSMFAEWRPLFLPQEISFMVSCTNLRPQTRDPLTLTRVRDIKDYTSLLTWYPRTTRPIDIQ